MKTLTSSVGFQGPDGTLLANGSIILSLPAGMYEILSGGGQVYGTSVILNLDANAKINGSPQIWAGDELNGHPVYAVQLCSFPNGLGTVAWAQWDISGTAPIDLSLIVATSTGVSFPLPVLQNPIAPQNINGQTLNMEGASVGFSAAGSTVPDTFFSRLSAGVIAIGTAIGNALGGIVLSLIKQPAATFFSIQDANGVSHFFISNSAPYVNTFVSGNGAGAVLLGSAGKCNVSDTSGQIVTAGGITIQTSAQTLPASINNDTAGGILFTNSAGGSMQFGNGGTLFLNQPQGIRWTGATSGNTVVQAAAVAGAGTLTLPGGVNDTLVAKNTTDILQNKSFGTGIAQGSGLKHQRFGATCTTAATAGTACTSTYTWTAAFADTNYTAVCQGEGNVGGTAALFMNARTATQISVQVVTFTATAVSFSAVDCVAIHD